MASDHQTRFPGWRKWLRRNLRWFVPGIGVKRWTILLLGGTTLLGLGLAVLILDVYREAPETWWLPALSILSLRFLPRVLRAVIFGGLGLGMVFLGTWGITRTLISPYLRPGRPVVEAVSSHRRRERGPKVVAIGGGHGLATLLRGLKQHTYNITAIVTVADNGGSSGELRRTMGILPPGDIRNCLAALSDDEALLSQLFQYRFGAGAGLNGHSMGNLLITALTDLTGSFEAAVAESGRVLAVRGRVLPSTLRDVQLEADIQADGVVHEVRVLGESQISEAGGQIRRVWLQPNNPPAFPPAIQAILNADLVIVGPGSLYTSLLPNLLVPDIAEALLSTRAQKFFISNVATQPGETTGYSTGDHVRAIEEHLQARIFDVIVANNYFQGRLHTGSYWVYTEDSLDEEYAVYRADLSDRDPPWRHDSKKLAQVVMDLFYERTGPPAGQISV